MNCYVKVIVSVCDKEVYYLKLSDKGVEYTKNYKEAYKIDDESQDIDKYLEQARHRFGNAKTIYVNLLMFED